MTNKVENQGETPPHKQNVGVTPDKVDLDHSLQEPIQSRGDQMLCTCGEYHWWTKDGLSDLQKQIRLIQREFAIRIAQEEKARKYPDLFQYVETDKSLDQLLTLFTKHSEQVELEARISELKTLADFFKTHHLFSQEAAMKLNFHINDRLANLQQSNKEK